MKFGKPVIAMVLGAAVLAGCRSSGDIVADQGVGITSFLTACPAIGIPDYTGDVTTFKAVGSRDASQIDVTAAMTNVTTTCDESGSQIYATAEFDVLARRTDTRGARQVELPYFVTILRGGRAVISKRVGTVTLNFANGQERAQARGTGAAYVDRAEATLPADIREQITRRRKAGDADAAVDPLSRPEVKAAIDRASFEMLLGFQLTPDQLAYNATR